MANDQRGHNEPRAPRRRSARWFDRQLKHVERVFAAADKRYTPEELRRARRALGYPKPFDEV